MIFGQVHHCKELLSNTGHHALTHFPVVHNGDIDHHNDDDADAVDDDKHNSHLE